MNDRLRQQLRELRIDPDATLQWPYGPSGPSPSRFAQRKLVMTVLAVIAVCTLLSGGVVLVAATQSAHPASKSATTRRGVVSTLRFAPLTLEIGALEYRSVATDGTVPGLELVNLRISAKNESDSTAVLAAGDVNLVDPRGALFAPTWREPTGAIFDGFGEPQHTLFALDPLGETEVTLVFAVPDAGPYTLRLLRAGESSAAVVVPL